MRTFILLMSFICVSQFCISATIQVPGDYPTIQEAIDAAVQGDTVLVDPGTYLENLDFKGKAITVTSSGSRAETVINGKDAVDPKFASVVMFMNGEGADSVLEGFTLMNGNGTYEEVVGYHKGQVGGAVFCMDSSPTIRDNLIVGCWADYGGAFACMESVETRMKGAAANNPPITPILTGNICMNNSAVLGGGVACLFDCSPVISDNLIRGNLSGDTGGGIYGWEASPLIMNNIIVNNSSNFGGGIGFTDGTSDVVNNIIVQNSAGYGGGAYVGFHNATHFVNNTFYSNVSDFGRALCSWMSSPTVRNSIFWTSYPFYGPTMLIGSAEFPSTLTISHSNVKQGKLGIFVESGCTLNWGDGMIQAPPLFVDAANLDLHLTYSSPCRGAGDNSVPQLPDFDFENNPRVHEGAVDMGADEFHSHHYCTGSFTPGGEIEGKLVGLPDTSPVGLLVGSGVRETPLSLPWGDFFLVEPWFVVPLPSIPSTGILEIPYTIPMNPSAPYDIPMQAIIGDRLTQLFVLEVR